jgi:hypothetical protein
MLDIRNPEHQIRSLYANNLIFYSLVLTYPGALLYCLLRNLQ